VNTATAKTAKKVGTKAVTSIKVLINACMINPPLLNY
jgi:hypothetical protein